MSSRKTFEDQNFLQPSKYTTLSPAFLVSVSIFLLLLIVLGGYSVFEFRQIIVKSNQMSAISVQRDSLIITAQTTLVQIVSLSEAYHLNPSNCDSLRRELDRSHAMFSSIESKYLSLVGEPRDSLDRDVALKGKRYFSQAEILVEQVGRDLTVSSLDNPLKGSRGESRGEVSIRTAFSDIMSDDLYNLLQAEQKCTVAQELFKNHIIRVHAWRWFISSFLLIGLIIVSAGLLVHRQRKIESGLKRFHVFLEYSANPVQVADSDGVTQYANPAFLAWSGMDRSSLVGQNLFNRLTVSDKENHSTTFWVYARSALISGKAWTGEVEFQRADGRSVVSELVISPVLNAQGKLSGCIALHSDLTEQKEFTRKVGKIQQQYRDIVESSLDGIIVVQDERLVYANPTAIHIFGYISAEEMKMADFNSIVTPAHRQFLFMSEEGHVIGEEIFRNYEIRGLTKSGKMIDLEANAHVVEWNASHAVQVSFRDITERKLLEREQALWLWEQETLSEIDRKLVGVVDLEKLLATTLQQTLNLTHSHFGGVLLLDETRIQVQWKAIQGNMLSHPSNFFGINELLQSMFKNEEPLIIHESDTEAFHYISAFPVIGNEKLVSTAWFPLMVEGRTKGMLVVGYRQYHDFVGREIRLLTSLAEKHSIAMVNAQLYNDLFQREKELEILSGARVQAQEEERRRIAREIHDSLGQMLTAIKFNLEILEDTISVGEEERERITDMKELLDGVMKEARELSYNLMPSVLDDFGLAPALQLLSEQFADRTNVKVMFHAQGLTERLGPHLEIGLYRIAQESLNNVAKHAEATEINLQVIRHADGIRLVIEDNGKGILNYPNIERATTRSGIGLVSMRERASSFGGILTIDSTPGRGTLLTVDIPLTKPTTNE